MSDQRRPLQNFAGNDGSTPKGVLIAELCYRKVQNKSLISDQLSHLWEVILSFIAVC